MVHEEFIVLYLKLPNAKLSIFMKYQIVGQYC